MKIGYTKAYRKELESDIWKMSPLYQRVFFYLRQEAVWKPELFPTRKKYKIALNPGQLITSFSNISEGVSWYEYGVKKVPNKKIIKDILCWLESNSMVTVESNRHGTFIMITNWDTYNCIEGEKVTQDNQTLVTQKKRQLDTLKEGKEGKEEKKKKEKKFMSDSIEYRLSNYLFNLILKRNPNHKKPNLQTWAQNIDLMHRLDKRSHEEIKLIIQWCQQNEFWHKNILSTIKLRDKYDTLFLQMQSEQGGLNNGIKPEHIDLSSISGRDE